VDEAKAAVEKEKEKGPKKNGTDKKNSGWTENGRPGPYTTNNWSNGGWGKKNYHNNRHNGRNDGWGNDKSSKDEEWVWTSNGWEKKKK
jgi:hypothetical protein